jgi:hypothetical protein
MVITPRRANGQRWKVITQTTATEITLNPSPSFRQSLRCARPSLASFHHPSLTIPHKGILTVFHVVKGDIDRARHHLFLRMITDYLQLASLAATLLNQWPLEWYRCRKKRTKFRRKKTLSTLPKRAVIVHGVHLKTHVCGINHLLTKPPCLCDCSEQNELAHCCEQTFYLEYASDNQVPFPAQHQFEDSDAKNLCWIIPCRRFVSVVGLCQTELRRFVPHVFHRYQLRGCPIQPGKKECGQVSWYHTALRVWLVRHPN